MTTHGILCVWQMAMGFPDGFPVAPLIHHRVDPHTLEVIVTHRAGSASSGYAADLTLWLSPSGKVCGRYYVSSSWGGAPNIGHYVVDKNDPTLFSVRDVYELLVNEYIERSA